MQKKSKSYKQNRDRTLSCGIAFAKYTKIPGVDNLQGTKNHFRKSFSCENMVMAWTYQTVLLPSRAVKTTYGELYLQPCDR